MRKLKLTYTPNPQIATITFPGPAATQPALKKAYLLVKPCDFVVSVPTKRHFPGDSMNLKATSGNVAIPLNILEQHSTKSNLPRGRKL